MNAQIILIEDDEELREATRQALELANFHVEPFSRADDALVAIPNDFDGVVVSDIRMPGMDGLELFARLAERDPELPIILVTGHADVPMAVDAMRRGAADFLTKPYPTSALIDAIERAAARRALVIENRRLREALNGRSTVGLAGSSEAVRRLDRLASEVARTNLDVQVTGGSGMGKTHLARRLHDLSDRRTRPFVTIDVGVWTNGDAELLVFGRDPAAGLSRSGLIERARGGTLLLDDAETIPEALRGRIRALLEKREVRALGADRAQTVDVRIFAAIGNEGLGKSSPLAHLGGVTIAIPPLDDRREDIPAIFRQFVADFEHDLATSAKPLSSDEWTFLLGHDWPGGLRELKDFARMVVLGLARLAGPARQADQNPSSLRDLVAAFERTVLEDALRATNGQVDAVQSMLTIKRKTLYDKLARYDLKPQRYRSTTSHDP